jgi:hypothetical protein
MRWSRTAVFVVVGSCTASMDPWMIDGWCQSSRAACSDQRMPAAISDRFSSRLQGPGLDYFSDQCPGGVCHGPLTPSGWLIGAVRLGEGPRVRPGTWRQPPLVLARPKEFCRQTTATNRVDSRPSESTRKRPRSIGSYTVYHHLPAFPLAPCHSKITAPLRNIDIIYLMPSAPIMEIHVSTRPLSFPRAGQVRLRGWSWANERGMRMACGIRPPICFAVSLLGLGLGR